MSWKEEFQFLDAKRKLMAPYLRADSALNYEMMYSHILSRIDDAVEPIPAQVLRSMDGSLESTIAEEIIEDDEKVIRAELKKRFGFASFEQEPRRMLQRIKRRGRIDNDQEAVIVDRHLSGDFFGGLMSDFERKRFSGIARAYYERAR